MVFLPFVDISKDMCNELTSIGMSAIHVDSYMKDTKKAVQDFCDGKYQVVCNSMLLTEGFDYPEVSCIVNLRNTDSRSLYIQIIGRGTRPFEGKEDLLVLDFLYRAESFDLCRPSMLFAKDKEVARRMEVELSDEMMDLLGLNEYIVEQIEREREAGLLRQLEKNRNKRVKNIDPIAFSVYVKCYELMDYEPIMAWESEECPESLKDTLFYKGIDVTDIKRGRAEKVLEILYKRESLNLASPKQVNLLRKYKYLGVESLTKEQGTKLINLTRKNRWKPLKKYQNKKIGE
jgi:superfamily II DNA or RNA helicase